MGLQGQGLRAEHFDDALERNGLRGSPGGSDGVRYFLLSTFHTVALPVVVLSDVYCQYNRKPVCVSVCKHMQICMCAKYVCFQMHKYMGVHICVCMHQGLIYL